MTVGDGTSILENIYKYGEAKGVYRVVQDFCLTASDGPFPVNDSFRRAFSGFMRESAVVFSRREIILTCSNCEN